MCDNFSATCARTVISSVPPETDSVILFLAFSNWKMITKLYTHRNLRPFNSIVVENPTIPNYSFNFVPAHWLFLPRCWKQYLGRYNKTFNIVLEIKPGENIMTHFRVYVLKYALQRKFGLYAALSIAVLVYNQFETLFNITQENPLHCL